MISLARVRVAVGLESDDNSQDELLTILLAGAVAWVGTQTNRYFGPQAATREYLAGRGIRELHLLSLPYAGESYDVMDVTEQKAPDLNVTSLDPVAADGFELRRSPRSAWLVRRAGNLWRWGMEYIVDYVHGWDVDGLPADIEQVVLSLVIRRFGSLDSGDAGVMRSETIGGYSYTRFSETDLAGLDGMSETLAAWREPVLA